MSAAKNKAPPAAFMVIDANARAEPISANDVDLACCLSCGKLAAENSGDNEVWHWKWVDGRTSTMPRGLKPGLCIPCARAAQGDVGDKREARPVR
jgi:hypothetical protein